MGEGSLVWEIMSPLHWLVLQLSILQFVILKGTVFYWLQMAAVVIDQFCCKVSSKQVIYKGIILATIF